MSDRVAASDKERRLKRMAKLAMVLLLVEMLLQIDAIWQTKRQLVSPLIVESLIWQISRKFYYAAIIASVASIISVLLYCYRQYLFIIIIAMIVLIGNRVLDYTF
jgi:hypothetical protein